MKTMKKQAGFESFKPELMMNHDRIGRLSQILSCSILTDSDWRRFKMMFEQVHQYFFATLKISHPQLTEAEVRIAALVKLNLNTREMADMLAISADSANKARYRLRKKLQLHPDDDLGEFIEKVSAVSSYAA